MSSLLLGFWRALRRLRQGIYRSGEHVELADKIAGENCRLSPITATIINDVSWLSLGDLPRDIHSIEYLILLARPKRFELLTPRFVVWCWPAFGPRRSFDPQTPSN